MGVNITSQGTSFLCAVVLGAAIGFLYDLFRILRKSHKFSVFMVGVQDGIFVIVATIFIILFLYVTDSLHIRGFNILGGVMGMLLYLLTLSRFFVTCSVVVIHITENILTKTMKLLLTPFYFLLRPIVRMFEKTWKKLTQKMRAVQCATRFWLKRQKIMGTNDIKRQKPIDKREKKI